MCPTPPYMEERGQEARVEPWRLRACVVSATADQQWSGAACVITADSGAQGRQGPRKEAAHHRTVCLEQQLRKYTGNCSLV